MNQTTFQPAEIYDSNGNIIQQGAYGINTPFCTSTGDGVYDYIVNNLNALKDMMAAGYVAVATLPSSGQTNKYYVITEGANAGKCYVWTGSAWQELTTQINGKSAYEIAVEHGFIGTEQQWLDSFTADAIAAANRAEAAMEAVETGLETLEGIDARFANVEDHAKMTDSNVDATKKRISNVEKLLQGNLYDYQTDSTEAYTKTVPAGALPYAGIEKIGGKTLVWNQVLNAISASGWKNHSNNYTTISFEDAVATITVTASSATSAYYYGFCRNYQTLPLVVNHVYAYLYEAKSNIGNRKFGGEILSNGTNEDGTAVNADTWYQMGGIGTASKSLTQYLVKPIGGNYSDLVYSIRNAMLFDLTLMFGSGNEPTTIEQFREMFPAEYYPYNAGTLLSAGVTEVKSVGVNLFDKSTAQVGYINDSDGTQRTGTPTTDASLCTGYISVQPNTSYYFLNNTPNGNWGAWYDINKNFISGFTGLATRTSPANAYYVRMTIRYNNNVGSPDSFCLNKSNALYNGNYYPYNGHTHPVPAEIQSLEGYGWSAGTAYNYVDFERKVFVQNVGRVDLGTLNWTNLPRDDEPKVFASNTKIPNVKAPSLAQALPNAICRLYIVRDYEHVASQTIRIDKSLNIVWASSASAGKVYICDSTPADATALKTSLNGVYLYYELATPVETDISAYLSDDNLIEVESDGTLTMYSDANGDDDAYHIPVPSTVEYMIDLNVATGGTENEP